MIYQMPKIYDYPGMMIFFIPDEHEPFLNTLKKRGI